MKIYALLSFLLVLCFWPSNCNSRIQNVDLFSLEVRWDEFYYFGFGSNMLSDRIHIQNPTARIVGPVVLQDYRLDFATISLSRWDGAAATIVPTLGYDTWGTLWVLNLTDLPNIDDQEGVHLNLYKPVTVQVELDEIEVSVRAYLMVNQPVDNLHELDTVPFDRQPSKTYLKVLVKGAIESGVPDEYVYWLRGIKHNNITVKKFEDELDLHDVILDN